MDNSNQQQLEYNYENLYGAAAQEKIKTLIGKTLDDSIEGKLKV